MFQTPAAPSQKWYCTVEKSDSGRYGNGSGMFSATCSIFLKKKKKKVKSLPRHNACAYSLGFWGAWRGNTCIEEFNIGLCPQ